MVASTFGWDTAFMAAHFGWRAAIAVCINAAILTWICRDALTGKRSGNGRGVNAAAGAASGREPGPSVVIAVPLVFLVVRVLPAPPHAASPAPRMNERGN